MFLTSSSHFWEVHIKSKPLSLCYNFDFYDISFTSFLTWAILKGVSLSVQSKFGMDFGFVVNIDAAVVVLDSVENSPNVDALSRNINIFL